ncbi:tRNA (adenosine(37)-N6)-threonylcarbamoyltransferase complex dimerization subunit type 1 TsaB [Prochlorococcus marinus]|uniref:tRNA (Adenosine(37)-N6)-threonylcarbamoyltransferase complex dimerization subunit type 1 TsaB n=1 Tax=Prochlorococcus marinus XMU1408 TaxID=2213228 RepID=A0A318R674_PROMR|nr:tRNA (adenosine(37)-N6)-threonylcarbamoyltransferase complex dimerization subunit type 1 TsaB [Prochlorococcus marinus]MBW3041200.1 tRNA (adenosine(37)-N6)-threonylcarbamoyltransferase complex dimerization subunit type 1 TsaB [Prochlorococcus marinus str. XMU1408]PYE03793.1 tRNA (adenosine(37)-N6)-threonylcarbamoyltransferase complex dimerization subunit type 1 TsaB [Prochlorococcus marinus XMU1408]
MQNFYTSKSKYLLALHSCSESFGIAVKDTENHEKIIKSEVFNIGRSLSNKLFSCVEKILPKEFWTQIIRISVAKGPGSFTSTRLTISMARTIAQQVNCSLDSISSFHLMASRLYKDLNKSQIYYPFWIKDTLPRRGIVAGKYKLIKIHKESNYHEFNELIAPKLIINEKEINPAIYSSNNVEKDIISLIEFSQYCQTLKINSNWQQTLPIYPTSPIDHKKL